MIYVSIICFHIKTHLIGKFEENLRPCVNSLHYRMLHDYRELILNTFSSENTGPITVNYHLELLWDGGTQVCSNGPDHMTKMAAIPIYGKNLKQIFFPGTKRPMTLKLGIHDSVFESTGYLKFAKLQYVSSGFRCRVITGSLMRLY